MLQLFTALRRRARAGQRGAVAVEAALITPILVAVLFAIIEFGFAFKDWIGITSAARSGARTASAEPRNANFASDAAAAVAREGAAITFDSSTVLWVYKAGSNGYPTGQSSFNACPANCAKFTWSTASQSFVQQAGAAWPAITQNACQGDPNRDSVGVYLSHEQGAITKMFFNSLTLRSRAVMALEPVPATSVDLNGCKP